MKLNGKTILITGGTSGIGRELAEQLLKRGNTVLLTGRDAAKLSHTQRALPAIHTFQSDVSDPQAIRSLAHDVLRRHPTLDVLINNAGIMRNLDLDGNRELDDVTREVDINLSGPIRMVQQFLPHLRTRPGAAIVNVSSGLAFVPLSISPVYSATKAALHSYTQSLRQQLKSAKVTVIELAPPGTETPLFRGEFEREMKHQKALPVAELVERAIRAIESGKVEIRPGLSNVLKLMSRLAPDFMFGQLAKVRRQ